MRDNNLHSNSRSDHNKMSQQQRGSEHGEEAPYTNKEEINTWVNQCMLPWAPLNSVVHKTLRTFYYNLHNHNNSLYNLHHNHHNHNCHQTNLRSSAATAT